MTTTTETIVLWQFPNGSYYARDSGGKEYADPNPMNAADRGWTDYNNASFYGEFEGKLVEFERTVTLKETGRTGEDCWSKAMETRLT